MSKYTWLFICVLLVIITTFIVQELATLSIVGGIENGFGDEITLDAAVISGFIRIYFKLLFFDIEGVPAIVSMFFIPLNLVIGVILGEIAIKIVDAIVPF